MHTQEDNWEKDFEEGGIGWDDPVTYIQTLLDRQREDIAREVKELSERDMGAKCQIHSTPRGQTAMDYNCSDIHLGYQEMASDLLARLRAPTPIMNIEQALQKTLGFGAKTFIERAIEGGWKPWHFLMLKDPENVGIDGEVVFAENKKGEWQNRETLHINELVKDKSIFLDPLAWTGAGFGEEEAVKFVKELWK